MTKKILIILICLLSSTMVYSQCKIKTKGKIFKFINKNVPIEIKLMTESKPIFDKYYTSAGGTFAIATDNEYYFIVSFMRGLYSVSFSANEKTPIIFYLDNGEELSLFPNANITGKRIGLQHYLLVPYYKITKENIERFATNSIISVRIYFIAEKEIENSFEDDLGRYFEFDIKWSKYQNNVFDAANCILQH